MANNLVPTTELEAVNTMLESIGETPISNLNVTGLVDAEIARSTLTKTSRAVQLEGWHWNREIGYPIAPNTDGELTVPADCLEIEPYYRGTARNFTQRGQRIYDVKNQTYTFTETTKFNWTRFLPFTDLPEAARWYITLSAARRFQRKILMSDTVDGYTAEDEKFARAKLEAADHRTNNPNLVTDNYATSRMVTGSRRYDR